MGKRQNLADIDRIIIHCADTPNGRRNTVEDIDHWHGERNPPFKRDMDIAPDFQPHLKHIGYHFVIEVDGNVVAGRPIQESGAHVRGFNENSIGICLVGRNKFSVDQWIALRELVNKLRRQLPAKTVISGHNQHDPNKACPGFDVHAWHIWDYRPLPENILC